MLASISALALGLAACGGGVADGDYVATHTVVGSANTTPSRIVAEIYATALRGTGMALSTDLAVGDRADAIRALESGRVSLIPDHSGALIEYFQPSSPVVLAPPADADPLDKGVVAAETYRQLSSVLPEYLRVSDHSLAEQRPSLVMSTENANRLQIANIGDLGPQCTTLTLGVEPGMLSQATILNALAEADGCVFANVVQVDSIEQARTMLMSNAIQVLGTYAGAPGMDGSDVTTLSFPVGQLPTENVIPLFRQGSLDDDEIRALNKVAGELTTEDLQDMVSEVEAEGRPIGTVVADWAVAHLF